ncbi:MAG: tetraacyldisaccharide 4'-kinase, partial [Xanthomonadales bacterium]|nr:tetraacyldisaccharide 4'-kinase [Xanthomonadales bacterium]
MRRRVEQWLNRTWYGGGSPPLLLGLLEPVYRAVSERQMQRARRRQPEDLAGRPIVVVGNLAAGGTGKTPLVIHLCHLFEEAGLNPGVVSRGYRRSIGTPHWVDADSDPLASGDEPVLVALATGCPVRVDHDRPAGARALFERGVDVVISDDGLQHLALPRSLEICVVDGERGFGNARMLPAGPLREPPSRALDCDFVVLTGGGRVTGLAQAVPMQLEPGELAPVGKGRHGSPPAPGARVHAVTGIGHPERFEATLREAGFRPRLHAFADHHVFEDADFRGL